MKKMQMEMTTAEEPEAFHAALSHEASLGDSVKLGKMLEAAVLAQWLGFLL